MCWRSHGSKAWETGAEEERVAVAPERVSPPSRARRVKHKPSGNLPLSLQALALRSEEGVGPFGLPRVPRSQWLQGHPGRCESCAPSHRHSQAVAAPPPRVRGAELPVFCGYHATDGTAGGRIQPLGGSSWDPEMLLPACSPGCPADLQMFAPGPASLLGCGLLPGPPAGCLRRL